MSMAFSPYHFTQKYVSEAFKAAKQLDDGGWSTASSQVSSARLLSLDSRIPNFFTQHSQYNCAVCQRAQVYSSDRCNMEQIHVDDLKVCFHRACCGCKATVLICGTLFRTPLASLVLWTALVATSLPLQQRLANAQARKCSTLLPRSCNFCGSLVLVGVPNALLG